LCSNYEIKEELGEGAFAHVYKAFDKEDGKTVALKCIDITKHITKEKNKSIKDLKIRLL
jgi:serine/threonine protein kinase